MKILFLTRHFACLRNFERALIALAERGHRVHLAAMQEEAQGGRELVERLARDYAGITVGWTPSAGAERRPARERLRLALDYLRYLDTTYADAPRLTARAEERTPIGLLWLLNLPGARSAAGRQRLARWLKSLEDALPEDAAIGRYLAEQAPDIVLFTPLIGLGSPEVEYLAAACRRGLRSVFCVWSWDNLSSKSLLRDMPQAVTVWNETQKREAMELHAVPPDRVVVTGAQCFDQWFDRTPSRSRAELCRDAGLPDDRPYLLYVCSSLFRGSASEAEFVRRWALAVRQSDRSPLKDTAILVRPHPSRTHEWKRVPLDDIPALALWGANPITASARHDYFDSLAHASAVVGLNTSAMIEAAIAGRPVLTVLLPEFAANQEGTLHFRYLLDPDHGLLHAARSLPEHVAKLEQVLANPDEAAARSHRFVSHFVRPFGPAVAGTDRFVAAVEEVGRASLCLPVSADASRVRLAQWLLDHAESWPVRALLQSPREREELARRADGIRAHRRAKLVEQVTRYARWVRRAPWKWTRERVRKASRRWERAARQREKQARLRRKRREQSRAERPQLP